MNSLKKNEFSALKDQIMKNMTQKYAIFESNLGIQFDINEKERNKKIVKMKEDISFLKNTQVLTFLGGIAAGFGMQLFFNKK
jgi:hypothetical protein